jgi:hypothetical protein
MKIFFPSILRKALPVLCLLVPSAILTGCGPDNGEPLFRSAHTASYPGPTVDSTIPDRHAHQRPSTHPFSPPQHSTARPSHHQLALLAAHDSRFS